MNTPKPNTELQKKLNKHIAIKLPKKKGVMGMFSSGKQQVFRIPPLNAVIDSGYGASPKKDSKAFKGFQAGAAVNKINDIGFLNWISIKKNTFDDPNKHRVEQLKNYEILKPMNQDCCGACWAVSSSMAFSDRYGIANDEKPIDPSVISIMSCCTKQKHKNVFKLVDTPDCDIMSSYEELERSNSTMGMCSGGIPYSAGLTILRNGLPNDSKTKYTSELFLCDKVPSFPNMNKAIIDKYACDEKLFDDTTRIRMDPDEKPVYISSSQGHPSHYIDLMKKALLEGGPLVAGFLVLGDNLGLGTDAASLGMEGDKILNWDTTGKVYVPGAYDKEWPFVMLSGVGGSSTVNIDDSDLDKQSKIFDTGSKPKAPAGEIFCGFHAVVIVGWGELDMKYVTNKDVHSVKGKDGKDKLPFWICRNSWGDVWPLNDYYAGGITVMVDGKEETLNVPGGYWLHAMYPNESMGLDVPVNYEGTDYGATMVMTPEKVTNQKIQAIVDVPEACDTEWKDKEGYNCSQYGEYNWCTKNGEKGDGWDDDWGDFNDFRNRNYNATEICCECGHSGEIDLSPEEVYLDDKTIITVSSFFVFMFIIIIVAIFVYNMES